MEMSNTPLPPRPAPRRSIWPFLIVGLLGAHVVGMVVAVTITEHDKTFLVVPDYYDKAQHWDAEQAEKRSSEGLGWTMRIEPAAAIDAQGNRAVRFQLTDAKGQAVPIGTLAVNYFHHAHPGDQRKAILSPDTADARTFTALLPMPFPGVWEFHFIAREGDKRFVQTQTQYVISQNQADAAEQ